MSYFVLQHPTRGWYTGRTYDSANDLWKPKFAWSIAARNDRVRKMFTQSEISAELNKMPEKISSKCIIKELK